MLFLKFLGNFEIFYNIKYKMSKTAQEMSEINNSAVREHSQKLIAGIDIELEKYARLLMRTGIFTCEKICDILEFSESEKALLPKYCSGVKYKYYADLYENIKAHYESLGYKVEVTGYTSGWFYDHARFIISWQ